MLKLPGKRGQVAILLVLLLIIAVGYYYLVVFEDSRYYKCTWSKKDTMLCGAGYMDDQFVICIRDIGNQQNLLLDAMGTEIAELDCKEMLTQHDCQFLSPDLITINEHHAIRSYNVEGRCVWQYSEPEKLWFSIAENTLNEAVLLYYRNDIVVIDSDGCFLKQFHQDGLYHFGSTYYLDDGSLIAVLSDCDSDAMLSAVRLDDSGTAWKTGLFFSEEAPTLYSDAQILNSDIFVVHSANNQIKALDIETGNELWSYTGPYDKENKPFLDTLRMGVDGENNIYSAGDGIIEKLDIEGNIVASKNVNAEIQNLLVDGSRVVCLLAREKRGIVAQVRNFIERNNTYYEPEKQFSLIEFDSDLNRKTEVLLKDNVFPNCTLGPEGELYMNCNGPAEFLDYTARFDLPE